MLSLAFTLPTALLFCFYDRAATTGVVIARKELCGLAYNDRLRQLAAALETPALAETAWRTLLALERQTCLGEPYVTTLDLTTARA